MFNINTELYNRQHVTDDGVKEADIAFQILGRLGLNGYAQHHILTFGLFVDHVSQLAATPALGLVHGAT